MSSSASKDNNKATTPTSPSTGPAGTPSNTPATSLFSKSATEGTPPKAFDLAADADINARLAKLDVTGASSSSSAAKKAEEPSIQIVTKLGGQKKAKESKTHEDEDDEDDEDDDEDDDEEDEDEEEGAYEDNFEYTADASEREAAKEEMENNQAELVKLLADHEKEQFALEKKYLEKMAPLFAARTEKVKTLPGFWVDVLLRNWVLGDYIAEHDIPALMHLNNISYDVYDQIDEDGDQVYGVDLKFTFDSNEFFTNDVLSKQINIVGLYRRDSTPGITKSTGTKINWKKGMDLTVEKITVKGRGGRNSKPVTKFTPRESFFNFFGTRSNFDPEVDDVSPDAMELMNAMWEMDMIIGTMVRNKVVPNAYAWYCGDEVETEDEMEEGEEEEDDEDEDDDDEDDDDDDDDEDDDDDDDDDDEEDAPIVKKSNNVKGKPKASNNNNSTKLHSNAADGEKPSASGGADGEEKPECKQQ